MSAFWKWALVLAVPAACVATARPADPPAQRPGHRMVAEEEVLELLLLRQKSVRDDLKMDQEEGKKVFEFTAKQHEAAEKVMALPEAEHKAKFDAMARENEHFLATHLTPEQRKRLEQISMHLAGLMWVTRPAIARDLNLTAEQKQKARQLQGEARAEVAAVIHAENRDTRRQKIEELHKANRERLMSLLTDEQKAKWKELAGPPFKGQVVFEEPEDTKKPDK